MEWFNQFAGIKMSSNYQTLDLLSRVIEQNPHLTQFIEIGTFTGSLSIYLGLESSRRNGQCLTIDIQKQFSEQTGILFEKLGIAFWEMDVFKERDRLFERFSNPLFLLCDGGNKADEFAMCVPLLKSGSIVCVHDYSKEFNDSDRQKWTQYAEPIMQDEWMKENVQLAIFRIK